MNCNSKPCIQVLDCVKRWMTKHPNHTGTWDVFSQTGSLDITISVYKTDGTRQLVLSRQEQAVELSPIIERRVLDWLDNLDQQPVL
jgi:hypothetical protein